MKKQFVKDLPIYLNGFAVGMLFFRSDVSATNVVAYAVAMITFFWYGKINKQSGGGIGRRRPLKVKWFRVVRLIA